MLIVADPGTGKTCSSQQLAYALAQKVETGPKRFIPVLVSVQRLVRVLAKEEMFEQDPAKVLLQYFDTVFPRDAPHRSDWMMMLRQAFEMRSVVVIVDGIDEAAGRKQQIWRFLCQGLVQNGHRVVATSRPEGIEVGEFTWHFVILDLKALTTAQQCEALRHQLASLTGDVKEFMEHLLSFSAIRKEHDRIWEKEAFESPEMRKKLESFRAPDLFVTTDGLPNPRVQQMCEDGTQPLRRSDDGPHSEYLKQRAKELCNVAEHLDPEREDLDAYLKEHCPNYFKLAKNLCLLCKKLGPEWTPSSLWQEIVASTDQMYVVYEKRERLFQTVLSDYLQRVDPSAGAAVEFGPLKDPVRIFEKAGDDYDGDVGLVRDLLRARVVCRKGEDMLQLLQMFASSQGPPDDGVAPEESKAAGQLCLTSLRTKNKCSEETLDPTHFRNVLVNCQLVCDHPSVFVEVQVHHMAVLQHNNDSHAHDHYDYFRAMLSNKYTEKLDQMLERMLLFFEETAGIPVLLSMVVLNLQHTDTVKELPLDRYGLYKDAIFHALKDGLQDSPYDPDDVLRILQHVALENQRQQRRAFSSHDVNDFLGSKERVLWDALQRREDGIPLLRILEVGADSGDCLYEFRHLSLQEALCGQALIGEEHKDFVEHTVLKKWVVDPYYQNTFRIGGSELGRVLSMHIGPELDIARYSAASLKPLTYVLCGTPIRTVRASSMSCFDLL